MHAAAKIGVIILALQNFHRPEFVATVIRFNRNEQRYLILQPTFSRASHWRPQIFEVGFRAALRSIRRQPTLRGSDRSVP